MAVLAEALASSLLPFFPLLSPCEVSSAVSVVRIRLAWGAPKIDASFAAAPSTSIAALCALPRLPLSWPPVAISNTIRACLQNCAMLSGCAVAAAACFP